MAILDAKLNELRVVEERLAELNRKLQKTKDSFE